MILNPATGRMVKKDGAIGKKILQEQDKKESEKSDMVVITKTANSVIYGPTSMVIYRPPMYLYFRHTYHGLFYQIMGLQPTCIPKVETFYGPLIQIESNEEEDFKKKLLRGDFDNICVTNRSPCRNFYDEVGWNFDYRNKKLDYLGQDFSYAGRTIGFIREKYGLNCYDDWNGEHEEVDYSKLIKISE